MNNLNKASLILSFLVSSLIALVWSKQPSTKTAVSSNLNHDIMDFLSNDTKLLLPSSSTSTINSINPVQNESKILENISQLPSPSPPSTTSLSPSSSITSLTSSMPSVIITNKGSSRSSYESNSTLKSTAKQSLSNDNDDNVTLINLSTVTISSDNISNLLSHSLPTNQHQQQQQQQQPQQPESQQSNQFDFLSVEFITITCTGLLILTITIVAGAYGCIKVYHKRYPARIGFGRKFSTFENPIYTQKSSSSCEIDCSRDNQAGPTGNEA